MKKILICLCLLLVSGISFADSDTGGIQLPRGISFRSWGSANEDIVIKITDAQGENFTDYAPIKKSRVWQDNFIDFASLEKTAEHDGDGKLDLPLRSFSVAPLGQRKDFGYGKVDVIQSVYLKEDNVSRETFDFAVRNLSLTCKTEKPGNLFYFGETPKGKIVPVNSILPSLKAKIALSYSDAFGKSLGEDLIEYSFSDNKTIEFPKTKGYVLVKWKADFENGMSKEGQFSYGIIPDNSKVRMGKASRFGINTHLNHGKDPAFAKIIKRLGFSWIRDSETNPNGDAVDIAKANDLQVFLTFSWLAHESRNYMLKQKELGRKPYEIDLSPYIQKYGECAEKWGDYIDYYDILNEPNCNGWLDFGGTYNSGPWNEWNTEWSKQVTKIIKEKDPDSIIVWEDMHLERFPEILRADARDEVDVISPHTYNFERGNPLPEKTAYFQKYDKFAQYMKKYGTDWKIIIGEVGVSNFEIGETTGVSYTPCSLEFAPAYLVRTNVMHLSGPAEKIFWFKFEDFFESRYDYEGNFGICYIDGTPKPIACAFSNMINILEGCEYTGRADTENKDVRIYGITDRHGKKGYVCWVTEGETDTDLKTDAKKYRCIDLYGNEKILTPKEGKLTLSLSPYPFYLIEK